MVPVPPPPCFCRFLNKKKEVHFNENTLKKKIFSKSMWGGGKESWGCRAWICSQLELLIRNMQNLLFLKLSIKTEKADEICPI